MTPIAMLFFGVIFALYGAHTPKIGHVQTFLLVAGTLFGIALAVIGFDLLIMDKFGFAVGVLLILVELSAVLLGTIFYWVTRALPKTNW